MWIFRQIQILYSVNKDLYYGSEILSHISESEKNTRIELSKRYTKFTTRYTVYKRFMQTRTKKSKCMYLHNTHKLVNLD